MSTRTRQGSGPSRGTSGALIALALVLITVGGVLGVRLLLGESSNDRRAVALVAAEEVAGEVEGQIQTGRAVVSSYVGHPDVIDLATPRTDGQVEPADPRCVLGEVTARISPRSTASLIDEDGLEIARAEGERCRPADAMERDPRPFVDAAGSLNPSARLTVLVGPSVAPDTDEVVVSAAARVIGTTAVLQAEVPLAEVLAGTGLTGVAITEDGEAFVGAPLDELGETVTMPVEVEGLEWTVVVDVEEAVAAVDGLDGAGGVALVVLVTVLLLAVVLILAVQQRALFHRSRVDPSTGLANRHQLGELIDERLAEGLPVVLLSFSLIRFRRVVEVLGHAHGDRLLAEVANRLAAVAPREAVLARISEEELAVALAGEAWRDGIDDLAVELREAMVAGLVVDGVPLDIGARVGVAIAPDHARDAPALLRRAATALRAASVARRDLLVYSADLDLDGRHQLTLAGELEQAIEDGSIDIELQPKLDLRTNEVVGLEALARWRRPSGDVAPIDFIPLAEATGRIGALTTLVLNRALEERSRLAEIGHDVHVAANLSAVSLSDESLADEIHDLLQHHETPPNRLVLELTETSIMSDPNLAVATLTRLRDLGVRVAVDDFGTGYSAMSYLTKLPVDEVKIDRSFVMPGHADLRVVGSVVRLAHDFGLNVVAEGVEDAEMMARLREMDCDHVQGYYIARPMKGRELRAWLANRRREDSTSPLPADLL